MYIVYTDFKISNDDFSFIIGFKNYLKPDFDEYNFDTFWVPPNIGISNYAPIFTYSLDGKLGTK